MAQNGVLLILFFANIGGFVFRYPPSLPQADRSLSDSTTLSKEATSNQSVKHAGTTEPMISDPEWQTLPSNQRTKNHKYPFGPSSCPCQYEGRSATYQSMSLENIHAHNYPFRNGRFRMNPSFIKPFSSDTNTSHISQVKRSVIPPIKNQLAVFCSTNSSKRWIALLGIPGCLTPSNC